MKKVMKKLIALFFFLSSLCLNGQSLSDSIPTLDNLLEVKWVVKGSKDSSNPLINDGLVFETFGLTYALQAETGQKLYFNDLKHQSIIRSTTKDSIIFFSSEEGVAIVNIYKGKIIFKSKGIPYKPFVNKPRVITDRFVYTALNDTTLVAIRIANGEIEWKKPCRKIFNLPLIKGEFIY
jgi:outer membrane protein assembly factor BamB